MAPTVSSKKASVYSARLTNPYFGTAGPRYFVVSAASREELARKVAKYKDAFEEARLGLRSPEEIANNLQRREIAKKPLSTVWAYHMSQDPRTQHRARLRAVWTHQMVALHDRTLDQLSAPTLRAWLAGLEGKGYSRNSRKNAYYFLRACVQREVDAGRLQALPWAPYTPHFSGPVRQVEKASSLAELVRLLEAAAEADRHAASAGQPADLVVRVVVLCLCALRKAEGAALGWDDLQMRDGQMVLTVRHQVIDGWPTDHPDWTRPVDRTKTDRDRSIVVHPAAALALEAQRETLRQRGWYRDDGPIFPGRKGCWRPNTEIIKWESWRRLCMRANLPNAKDWVVHSLRHSAAALEHASGMPLLDVMARTGHTTMGMAASYARTLRARPESRVGLPVREAPPSEAIDLPSVVLRLLASVREARAKYVPRERSAPLPQRRRSEASKARARAYASAYGRTYTATGDRGLARQAGKLAT